MVISTIITKDQRSIGLVETCKVACDATNSGEILNKGFEISASWNQKFNKDLSLTVGGNITTYDNKVLELNYPIG